MALEIWAHSPHLYPRAVVLSGLNRFVWTMTQPRVLGFQAQTFALRVVPQGVDFKAMVNYRWCAVEFDRDHPWNDPVGSYPTWDYRHHSIAMLEQWVSENRAPEFRQFRQKEGAPYWVMPKDEQPHKVIVRGIPKLDSQLGRRLMIVLEELQRDYPSCTLHLHSPGLAYSWLFGADFKAGTVWFNTQARKNRLHLPDGRVVACPRAFDHARIVRTLGFRPKELQDDKKTIILFNIKAAQWASENWDRPAKTTDFGNLKDPLSDDDLISMMNGEAPSLRPVKSISPVRTGEPMAGDKFFCDRCSYARTCRAFRVGSICTVSGSSAGELQKFFQTRNSGKIMEGLARLIHDDLERRDLGRQSEEDAGKIDPNVTKLSALIYKQGTELAKMIDPTLRPTGLSVNVNSGGPTAVGIGGSTPAVPVATLASQAMGALQAGGVPLTSIDAELIEQYLAVQDDPDEVRRLLIEQQAKHALPVFTIDEDDEEIIGDEDDDLEDDD